MGMISADTSGSSHSHYWESNTDLGHLNFTGTIFWEENWFWAHKPCLSPRIKLKQHLSCFSLTEPFSLSPWDANELGNWILTLGWVRVLTLTHLSCLGREESYQHSDFRVISDWWYFLLLTYFTWHTLQPTASVSHSLSHTDNPLNGKKNNNKRG